MELMELGTVQHTPHQKGTQDGFCISVKIPPEYELTMPQSIRNLTGIPFPSWVPFQSILSTSCRRGIVRGQRRRLREAKNGGKQCRGRSRIIKSCFLKPCPSMFYIQIMPHQKTAWIIWFQKQPPPVLQLLLKLLLQASEVKRQQIQVI